MENISTYIIEKFKISKSTIKKSNFGNQFCEDFNITDSSVAEVISNWCSEHDITEFIIYSPQNLHNIKNKDNYTISVDAGNFDILKKIVGPENDNSITIFSTGGDTDKNIFIASFSEALYIRYYKVCFIALKPINPEKV